MSKLQRAVDGQTIQFLSVPKIFNTLSADLPSGAIKLPNGELAYWRLNRNLTELKKNRKNLKDIIVRLAQTFKALVSSDAFLNHYGLTKTPEIPAEPALMSTFRSLLSLNTNRVDYTTISHGRQKPLVETIIVSLGNLTFFNAYRGVQDAPRVDGVKGKLWLTEGADVDQCFHFTVVSPVVKLSDFISGDRLASEILTKIRHNLALITHNPKIVFADGQFDNYVGRGIEQLAAKHEHKTNPKPQGEAKPKGPVLTKKEPQVGTPGFQFSLTKEQFASTTDAGRVEYIQNVSMARNQLDQKVADATIRGFLLSDILDAEYGEYNSKWAAKHGTITKPYYLAKIIGLIDEDVVELIGGTYMKFVVEGVGEATHVEVAGEQVERFQGYAGETEPEATAVPVGISGTDYILTKVEFDRLDEQAKADYFSRVIAMPTAKTNEEARALLTEFLKSGVWEEQRLKQYPVDAQVQVTSEFFLADVIRLRDDLVISLLGEDAIKFMVPVETGAKATRIDAQAGQSYTVKEGDTLFSISEEAYGNGDLWTNIHLANKSAIPDPTTLIVGQTLSIPELAPVGTEAAV